MRVATWHQHSLPIANLLIATHASSVVSLAPAASLKFISSELADRRHSQVSLKTELSVTDKGIEEWMPSSISS
jgi:hypothetical protein